MERRDKEMVANYLWQSLVRRLEIQFAKTLAVAVLIAKLMHKNGLCMHTFMH